ncbi:glycosyltransferase family 4 protein [Fusobacterium perfoetens]|uniref:glycosyltransferase family 4 protein n=1 Tax=Fusobacterium perfoetens TaxID=852 RepID=UPI00047F3D8F|nr:glycosyltransferase family 4 protein [Fusobacterium perfoetens]
MKKILFVGPFPEGNKGLNGQNIANQTLYDGLKENYDVYKINTLKELEFKNKKEQGKFKIKKFLKIFIYLIKEIYQILFNKYDVIYMTPGQSFLGFMRFSPYMLCSFIKSIPCYIHIHGGNFRNMYDNQNLLKKKVLSFYLKRLNGVIVLGNSLKEMFKGIINEDKIFVCENGVQDEIIASEEEIKEKIKNFNFRKKRKVLYLSNLMREKGILDVLESSKELSEEKFEIHLAGAIEPCIKIEIEKYLKEYPNKIFYYGIVKGNKKRDLFLKSDIFILPTYYENEGQPISILEAYVNGCSVITTNHAGIKDIFDDNINGKYCLAKNKESIIESLNYLKDKNYIEKNYYFSKERFSSKSFIKRVEYIIGEKNI